MIRLYWRYSFGFSLPKCCVACFVLYTSRMIDFLMLRYWTAGESHGPALTALVDGFPAGLPVDNDVIDSELQRRQGNKQLLLLDVAEDMGAPYSLVLGLDEQLPPL